MRAVVGFVLVFATATPCAAAKFSVVIPPPIETVPVPAGAALKPVSLTRMAANITPGKTWAEVGENPLCATEYTLEWESKNNTIEKASGFENAFRDAFANAGLKVAGDPTNLFEQVQTSSDLQVGALVTDVRARFCANWTGDPYRGSLAMTVEWQIFSVARAEVVARVRTEGGLELKKPAKDGIQQLIAGAFGDNARRLAANEGFRQLVMTAAAGAASPSPLTLRLAPGATGIPISRAADSVVAIFAGDGHGSGVVISPDGYILTNHHVAGANGQVRVRWADGTETVGEVLRGDRRRDIALVKVAPKAAALPIRPTPAEVGEAVFAIGTPLDPKFQGSVSKGIVSARRSYEGLNFIQSDVTVNPGNSGGPLLDEKGSILGITVLRFGAEGIPTGINLFIPIDEALKALALTPTS